VEASVGALLHTSGRERFTLAALPPAACMDQVGVTKLHASRSCGEQGEGMQVDLAAGKVVMSEEELTSRAERALVTVALSLTMLVLCVGALIYR
jgi:hypothetical protein